MFIVVKYLFIVLWYINLRKKGYVKNRYSS